MDLQQAMRERHSVRKYLDKPIEPSAAQKLLDAIDTANRTSGLNIQLVQNDAAAFDNMMAHYGLFSGCQNFLAIVGKPNEQEKAGYYGEQLVLLAQQLGLNTCWIALTYSKKKVKVSLGAGQKLLIIIAVGYGQNQGTAHKNKPMEKLYRVNGEMPAWFRSGMEAAMLAPTAINQQKFKFTLLDNNTVKAEATGGFYSDFDLGIVKYHFEIGAGRDNFRWA